MDGASLVPPQPSAVNQTSEAATAPPTYTHFAAPNVCAKVPIITTVSRMACGFTRETDSASRMIRGSGVCGRSSATRRGCTRCRTATDPPPEGVPKPGAPSS